MRSMVLPKSIRFKARDIWDTPDDGKRYEVIDGQLYVTPPPIPEHQRPSMRLSFHLEGYVHERDLGQVYAAPIGVELDDENGIQPDLVYVSRERLHIVGKKGIEGAPDLVVEILSPSTRGRDRGVKLRRYAAAGVPHYWIVDPRSRALEAYRLVERGYELIEKYGPGEVFRPELFPGLEIPIDDLWS
jgi:Uma2 family endonuclease